MSVLPNPRHEAFAQALASGKSADEAYQVAGYRANDGNCIRLKGNERIRARVAELQGAAAKKVVLDAAWVMEALLQNYNRAMQNVPVLDSRGKPTGEYRYEGSVANRAAELIRQGLPPPELAEKAQPERAPGANVLDFKRVGSQYGGGK